MNPRPWRAGMVATLIVGLLAVAPSAAFGADGPDEVGKSHDPARAINAFEWVAPGVRNVDIRYLAAHAPEVVASESSEVHALAPSSAVAISGLVTLEDGGVPLEGVEVMADRFDASGSEYLDSYFATTGVGGEYTISAPEGGVFFLYFDDPERRGASIAYDQQSFYGMPTMLTVPDSQSFGDADAVLPAPGTVSGTLTVSGASLASIVDDVEIYVAHYDDIDGWINTGWYWGVGSDGSFAIDDLAPGDYQLLAQYDGTHGIAFAISPAFTIAGDEHPWAPSFTFFSDVPGDRAFAFEIAWLAGSGISTGYTDGTFRPLGSVNRDAMAAFLYRFAGEPTFSAPGTSPFSDVATSSQFYKEITWLASTGITTGYPDGTFRPLAPVNRDAMAAFLHRFAGGPDFTPPSASPFTDVATSSQFYDEITWLASTGITTGYPDGTFRPVALVNRDAMAAFLFRYSILAAIS